MSGWIWLGLVLGGIALTITALAGIGPAAGFAIGLASVGVWVACNIWQAWYFGVNRHLLRHLGTPGQRWKKSSVVTHVIATSERADVQMALDHLHQLDPSRPEVFGIPDIASIISILNANPYPVPVEAEAFPRSARETVDCATNALYCLRLDGQPFLAFVRPRNRHRSSSREQMELEILAVNRDLARQALAQVLNLANQRSIYRGQVLALGQAEDRREEFSLRFHDLPRTQRDDIVLPSAVMAVLERNIVGWQTHAEMLRRSGRGLRHGLLLHGPPGTGKTLSARYFAHACPGRTVILLTGRELRHLRAACRLARLLAPSLVVLEDVDLIAADRRRNRHLTLLHELMDELDGLGADVDCLFVLTSNRPDVLEPALAARPGRVDQAIAFPLPDRECRQRLIARFGRGLDLSAVTLEPLLDRTEGASPAFLKELIRKATLMAAERGESGDPPRLCDDDLDRAVRELTEFGGQLTRQLLGFVGDPPR